MAHHWFLNANTSWRGAAGPVWKKAGFVGVLNRHSRLGVELEGGSLVSSPESILSGMAEWAGNIRCSKWRGTYWYFRTYSWHTR